MLPGAGPAFVALLAACGLASCIAADSAPGDPGGIASPIIYGTDDRTDMFAVTDAKVRSDGDSVVSLVDAASVVNNLNGTSTLATQIYGTRDSLCSIERFFSQPTFLGCSGFLVGARLIATAGHCVDDATVTSTAFVFGFRMQNATTAITTVPTSEVYHATSVAGRTFTNGGADWAVVVLDRDVPNHAPLWIRQTGTVANSTAIHMLGHPRGLPLKYTPGAFVLGNSNRDFFTAQLDAFSGNSGSPVFDSTTHRVEGILVRGPSQEWDETGAFCFGPGTGRTSIRCSLATPGCEPVEITRIAAIAPVVAAHPPTIAWVPPGFYGPDPFFVLVDGRWRFTELGYVVLEYQAKRGGSGLPVVYPSRAEYALITAMLPVMVGAIDASQMQAIDRALDTFFIVPVLVTLWTSN